MGEEEKSMLFCGIICIVAIIVELVVFNATNNWLIALLILVGLPIIGGVSMAIYKKIKENRELNQLIASKQTYSNGGWIENKKENIDEIFYCRMCGKKNASAFKVGPMEFFLCSQTCANRLSKTVVRRGMSMYGNMANLRAQLPEKDAYYCMWCGKKQYGDENICSSCRKTFGDACKLATKKLNQP